jgi:hypothetical protein
MIKTNIRTKKIKKKMSIAQKGSKVGEKNHMYGKHLTDEHKKKISDAITGEKNPNYGKKMKKSAIKKRNETIKKNKTFAAENNPRSKITNKQAIEIINSKEHNDILAKNMIYPPLL